MYTSFEDAGIQGVCGHDAGSTLVIPLGNHQIGSGLIFAFRKMKQLLQKKRTTNEKAVLGEEDRASAYLHGDTKCLQEETIAGTSQGLGLQSFSLSF